MKDIKKAIEILNQSDNHRVITRYKKPEFYNLNAEIPKKIGVFLDIEACILKISSKRYS